MTEVDGWAVVPDGQDKREVLDALIGSGGWYRTTDILAETGWCHRTLMRLVNRNPNRYELGRGRGGRNTSCLVVRLAGGQGHGQEPKAEGRRRRRGGAKA